MRSLMFLALGLSFAAAQSVRVEGRVVTDTGEAVAKAEVRLAAGPITLTSVGTNHDGKFVFADVPPGRYTVSAEKGGFIVQNNGALLDLTPGMDLKNIMIKMTPQGVVSGKVTDQDGDPMAGAQVYAMRYYYRWGRRELAPYRFSAVTNDLGDFRLGNIAPGRYYIGVTEKHAATAGDLGRAATEINLDTFYPGALDARSASQLDVTEGAAIQGIDIRLRRAKVYTVKGKAVYAASGAPLPGEGLELVPPNLGPLGGGPLGVNGSAAVVQPDGTFEFRNVIPGTYVVVPDLGPSANGERTRFHLGPPVTVSVSNIEGLTISLSPAAPITGTVTAQEGDLQTLLKSKTPRITLRLLPSEGLSGRPTLVQVKDDGVFRFPTAGVAKYWWSVSGVPEEVYVKSASFGEKDVTRAQLDDSTGEGGILRIVLSSQAASLSGAAPRGMTVRVWPRIPDLGDSAGGMRSVTADQDGGFRFAGLAPGEYYVAATDDIEQGLAESPEFLARFNGDALLVRLDKGEHAAVDVKLISAEKVATEIARLP